MSSIITFTLNILKNITSSKLFIHLFILYNLKSSQYYGIHFIKINKLLYEI